MADSFADSTRLALRQLSPWGQVADRVARSSRAARPVHKPYSGTRIGFGHYRVKDGAIQTGTASLRESDASFLVLDTGGSLRGLDSMAHRASSGGPGSFRDATIGTSWISRDFRSPWRIWTGCFCSRTGAILIPYC